MQVWGSVGMLFAASEQCRWRGYALQIFVRGWIDEGDAELLIDEPVCLLQMVCTVTQNDREQFQDGHFTAIMGWDHAIKGHGIVAL